MSEPSREDVPVEDLRVDERYWGAGTSEPVRRWLNENYDPKTMPPLAVSDRGNGRFYVLGWRSDSETLYHAVFGRNRWDEGAMRSLRPRYGRTGRSRPSLTR